MVYFRRSFLPAFTLKDNILISGQLTSKEKERCVQALVCTHASNQCSSPLLIHVRPGIKVWMHEQG